MLFVSADKKSARAPGRLEFCGVALDELLGNEITMKEYKLFIGGEWVPTSSGKVINDLNPADDTVYAKVHTAGPAEVEAAIASAYATRDSWAAALPEERKKYCSKQPIIWKKT